MSRRKSAKASLTVEAAFIVPIFLYAIVLFLWFFQIISAQLNLAQSMIQTARYYSQQSYVAFLLKDDAFEVFELGMNQRYKDQLQNYAKEFGLQEKLLVSGLDGISVESQKSYYEEDVVDFLIEYKCKVPILFFEVIPFTCIQRIHMNNYTGVEIEKRYGEKLEEQEESTDQQYVFITESGSKYHTHEDCTYLKLSIQSTVFEQISILRNKYKAKYTPCQMCCETVSFDNLATLYITNEGKHYHTRRDCSGLKRSVKKVLRDEIIHSYDLCSRCKKRDGQ